MKWLDKMLMKLPESIRGIVKGAIQQLAAAGLIALTVLLTGLGFLSEVEKQTDAIEKQSKLIEYSNKLHEAELEIWGVDASKFKE